jgi:hypothetical protein
MEPLNLKPWTIGNMILSQNGVWLFKYGKVMINHLINLILGRTNIMSREYQPILPQTLAVQHLKLFPRHGTFTIDSAQMVEEEEVEEIVREKRELPPEPEEVKETKDRAGAIWVLIGVGLEDGNSY